MSSLPPADVVTRLRAAGCVFAEDEAALLLAEWEGDDVALEAAVAERERGVPLEQILGWAEFAGLRIGLLPGVFVPRRRTELVARAGERLAPRGGTVVDLCCGSGAIAAAIAHARPDLRIVASDVDPVAYTVAARNLAQFGADAYLSDMDHALPAALRGTVDVVTACPPYVPTMKIALMPSEARDYEPHATLDGGESGAELQAQVFAAATRLLRPGGWCVVETSDHLADATLAAAADAGLAAHTEEDDELGAVVVVAQFMT